VQKGYLIPLKDREIILEDSQKRHVDLPSKSNIMGDRILLPTYWPNKQGVLRLVNFNGRSVHVDSKLKQVKAPVARASEDPEDARRLLNPTPPGFYLVDPAGFVESVAATHEVVIFEGPLNARAFKNIAPEVSSSIVAMCGKTYNLLIPFIRWLSAASGVALPNLKVTIATDFDNPGQEARSRIEALLEELEAPHVFVRGLLEQRYPGIGLIIDADSHLDMNDLWLLQLRGDLQRHIAWLKSGKPGDFQKSLL